MNQQQINEVQHNLQTALIGHEPSHIQTETVQQQMVMHYQQAPQSQIIVEHTSPSTQASQQHHVIVQQTPPHQQTINQQTIHQSQPIVITPPQQNVVRQPYTVFSQHKRVYHTAVQQTSKFMRRNGVIFFVQQLTLSLCNLIFRRANENRSHCRAATATKNSSNGTVNAKDSSTTGHTVTCDNSTVESNAKDKSNTTTAVS